MKEKLRVLYPQRYDETYKRIKYIIEEFKRKNKRFSKQKTISFDEKDIILVCYSDHVKEPKVKTLKTLKKFLSEFAEGLFNRIHLLAFFPYSYEDDFSVVDYYKVYKKAGDWRDVRSINKRFKLMFDLVLNHCSLKNEWFRKALQGNKRYSDYFISFDRRVNTDNVFRPRVTPLLHKFSTKDGKKYFWTTFSHGQVDLNYKNPDVLIEMIKILLFYVKNGAETIRLDSVAYLWKKKGTSSFNLPESHIIIQILNEVLKKVAKDTKIVSETVLPYMQDASYFGEPGKEAHMIYNFVLETLLPATIFKEDSTKATEWLGSIYFPGRNTTYLNLTGSHDGIHAVPAKGVLTDEELLLIGKMSKRKGGHVLYRMSNGKKNMPYEFNTTQLSLYGKAEPFLATQAIQLALRGIPLIYLNNLIGAENWDKGFKITGSTREINRERFNYARLSRELRDPKSKKYKVYNGYKRLLLARVNERLFSPLAEQKILKLDKRLIAIMRYKRGKKTTKRLIALTNISSIEVPIRTTRIISHLKKSNVKDILSGKEINLKGKLKIQPYESLWLK